MKEVYRQTRQELFEMYGSASGHTQKRAEELLQLYGENVLEEKGKKHILQIFLEQFADLLVVILLAASVVSALSGNVESTIVIAVVLVLNAVLGTVQAVKAEKSLDALKELSAPKAKVLRDGIRREVPSREIVPGDVLLLEAGDMVAADGRIIENHSLQVNESALTGESANVDKTDGDLTEEASLGDRVNMVFSGSLVTYGRASVFVTGMGMNTEMGKIAALMNEIGGKKTPLQQSLDEFSRKLAIAIAAVSVLVFGLRIYQKETVLDSLMFAVALAVAAIPEALSSIVTIVQAVGTRKMAADHAIIKELKAVESLGCVSVICSDKTGTLTQNKMTVQEVYVDHKCMVPEELNAGSKVQKYFLYNAVLNNDSSVYEDKEIGDPTETCLLAMAKKAGVDTEALREKLPRTGELPFDSDRKLMSSIYEIDGVQILFTKGAPDILLERLESVLTAGGIRAVTDLDKEKILRQNQQFSENGLRVLAFVCKECPAGECLCADSEYGYTFLGLASMADPPREESVQAVAEAFQAGIRPVMITGDHKVTATAIAKQIGIWRDGDLTVTGQELDAMSEKELDAVLEKISVYARVSPENKIRIVGAWQKRGNVTAMTGDGVNDAPALKKADIGIAMGITGTEVSKSASAMILADDHFATIIKAVLNGRNVYRNIINAVLFLLSGNLAAILVVLYCSFRGFPTPFEPVHLLFINLITDSLPALAIGMEPADQQLLKEKPRDPGAGIFTPGFLARFLCYGLLIMAVTQMAYHQGLQTSAAHASTMAFGTLALARLFHGFNCRSEASLFRLKLTGNLWSVAAFAAGSLLLGAVLGIPALQGIFSAELLDRVQSGWIVGLAVLPTILIQLGRGIRELTKEKRNNK